MKKIEDIELAISTCVKLLCAFDIDDADPNPSIPHEIKTKVIREGLLCAIELAAANIARTFTEQ